MPGRIALLAEDRVNARDLTVDNRSAEDRARHRVEGGRFPDLVERFEAAQQVGDVQGEGSQTGRRRREAVALLEHSRRRSEHINPVVR